MRFSSMCVIVWLMSPPVSAAIIWDQSDFDPSVNALVDQEFGDFPTYSSYMLMDVLTDPSGWWISDMKTYFTNAGGTFEFGVNQARLNIFHKTGAMPTAADNPQAQSIVPITVTNMGDHYEIHATGLNEWLAGSTEYWLGLTPIADFGVFGQEFHLAAPILGAETAWRNPGGSFGIGSGWQTVAAIDTTGQWVGNYDAAFSLPFPEPAGLALLALGALALPRRR